MNPAEMSSEELHQYAKAQYRLNEKAKGLAKADPRYVEALMLKSRARGSSEQNRHAHTMHSIVAEYRRQLGGNE